MAFGNVFRGILGADTPRSNYIIYTDSKGNRLAEDEILFLSGEEHAEFSDRMANGEKPEEIDIGLTVRTSGVKCDSTSGFPVVMAHPDTGMLAGIKVSKKTGEILPSHAGCCQEERVIMIGPASTGKTVCLLQYTDPRFANMVANGIGEIVMLDDMNIVSPLKKEYNKFRRDMMRRNTLPDPTPKGGSVPVYVYYTQCGSGEDKQYRMLRFVDISGEYCEELPFTSWVFDSTHFFLMIDAEDIITSANSKDTADEDEEEENRSEKVALNLIEKLRANMDFNPEKDYRVTVVITKADMLRNEEELKEVFDTPNTVEYTKERGWEKLVHTTAFHRDAYMRRSECIHAYLEKRMPNMCHALDMILDLPEGNLTWCMIASIGHECRENEDGSFSFDLMEPLFVDEPLLHLLTEMGIYPLATEEEPDHGEKVTGVLDGLVPGGTQQYGESFDRAKSHVMSWFERKFGDYDEDEEGEDDYYDD